MKVRHRFHVNTSTITEVYNSNLMNISIFQTGTSEKSSMHFCFIIFAVSDVEINN